MGHFGQKNKITRDEFSCQAQTILCSEKMSPKYGSLGSRPGADKALSFVKFFLKRVGGGHCHWAEKYFLTHWAEKSFTDTCCRQTRLCTYTLYLCFACSRRVIVIGQRNTFSLIGQKNLSQTPAADWLVFVLLLCTLYLYFACSRQVIEHNSLSMTFSRAA